MTKSIFRDLLKREEYLNYFHAMQLIEKCREQKILIFGWDIIDVQSDGLYGEPLVDFTDPLGGGPFSVDYICDASKKIIDQIENKHRLLYIPVIDY